MTTDEADPNLTASLFSISKFDETKDLPIIYNEHYNVALYGLQLMFPGDCSKWHRISEFLNTFFAETPYASHKKIRYASPNRPVSLEELKLVHSENYLNDVHTSRNTVASITESWLITLLPFCLIESRLLSPMKWQVAGSVMAAYVALKAGWSINIGGGFHHASSKKGETFCIFADISLIMVHMWRYHDKTHKFLIIDLDAHQGTGIERDIASMPDSKRSSIYVFDMCNSTAHPDDPTADSAVNCKVPLPRFTGDSTYLRKLKSNLSTVIKAFQPTLIIYNAGSDCLKNDPLGLMNLTDEALMIRDELVFRAANKLKAPIVMLMSGGYLIRSSGVTAKSIRNLYIKGIIKGPCDGTPQQRKELLMKYNMKYTSRAPKSAFGISESLKTIQNNSVSEQ